MDEIVSSVGAGQAEGGGDAAAAESPGNETPGGLAAQERDRAAEDAVARAELRLRDRALAATKLGVLITDTRGPDHPIVYANAAFEAMTGYTAEEVAGRNPRLLQGPDTDRAVVAAVRRAVAEGREVEILLRNYRKDGTAFWNEMSLAPVRDAHGRLTHYIGIQRDVTARVEQQDALREAEERLERALAAAEMGTWEWDLRTGRVVWSAETEALFGLPPGEFEGTQQAFLDRLHPADRPVAEVAAEVAVEQGTDVDVEYRAVRPDGRVRWLAARGRPYWDELRRPVRVSGTIMDVTERRRAQEERARLSYRVEEERAALVATMNSMTEGLIIYGHDWRARYCNAAAANLVGKEPADLVGLTPEEQFARVRAALAKPEEAWEAWTNAVDRAEDLPVWEVQFVGPPPVEVQVQAFPVKDFGTRLGVGLVLRDVSEARRSEVNERRLRLFEERERIAADLHDGTIQSLYGAVLALGTLRRELPDAPEAARTHEVLTTTVEQLLNTVKEIRRIVFDLSLSGTSERGLEAGLAAVSEEVRRTVGITTDIGVAPGTEGRLGPEATGTLLLLVREAVSNAVRHGQATAISIEAAPDGSDVVLTVTDNGRGFDAAGTPPGNGLASMAERARSLGGQCTVTSTPGQGTQVRVAVRARDEEQPA